MILVDANPLTYAPSRGAVHHEALRRLLREKTSGTIQVGLPRICILAFLRVTTHPRIFPVPLQPNQALAYVESWLAQPFVDAVAPGEGHWTVLHNPFALQAAREISRQMHMSPPSRLSTERPCVPRITTSNVS